MKYIHDSKNFLIFSAMEFANHHDMANHCGMKPVHAGFLLFNEHKGVDVYGESVSLKLHSQSFDLPSMLYAACDAERFNFALISNSEDLLSKMGLRPVQALWFDHIEAAAAKILRFPEMPEGAAPLKMASPFA